MCLIIDDDKKKPTISKDDHGTPSAGLCCGARNGPPSDSNGSGFCGVGVAYMVCFFICCLFCLSRFLIFDTKLD
jgi:hypothetical protein